MLRIDQKVIASPSISFTELEKQITSSQKYKEMYYEQADNDFKNQIIKSLSKTLSANWHPALYKILNELKKITQQLENNEILLCEAQSIIYDDIFTARNIQLLKNILRKKRENGNLSLPAEFLSHQLLQKIQIIHFDFKRAAKNKKELFSSEELDSCILIKSQSLHRFVKNSGLIKNLRSDIEKILADNLPEWQIYQKLCNKLEAELAVIPILLEKEVKLSRINSEHVKSIKNLIDETIRTFPKSNSFTIMALDYLELTNGSLKLFLDFIEEHQKLFSDSLKYKTTATAMKDVILQYNETKSETTLNLATILQLEQQTENKQDSELPSYDDIFIEIEKHMYTRIDPFNNNHLNFLKFICKDIENPLYKNLYLLVFMHQSFDNLYLSKSNNNVETGILWLLDCIKLLFRDLREPKAIERSAKVILELLLEITDKHFRFPTFYAQTNPVHGLCGYTKTANHPDLFFSTHFRNEILDAIINNKDHAKLDQVRDDLITEITVKQLEYKSNLLKILVHQDNLTECDVLLHRLIAMDYVKEQVYSGKELTTEKIKKHLQTYGDRVFQTRGFSWGRGSHIHQMLPRLNLMAMPQVQPSNSLSNAPCLRK